MMRLPVAEPRMTHCRHPGEGRDPALLPKNRITAFAGMAGLGRCQSGGAMLRLLLLIVVVAIAAAAYLWSDFRKFTETPLTIDRPDATIDIARGANFRTIVAQLRDAGATHASPWYWRALGRELHVEGRLHAGEYALTQGITPRELLRKMAVGEVLQHRFTIVDGWTFRQLRLALAADAGLAQTVTAMSDDELARKLGIDDGRPEGWFLPETYSWIKGDSDLDLLKNAHAAMQKALDRLWNARAPDLPFATPYEALILASIVEKETGRADERPLIAGVFVRRLRFHMRLQTDPTVIYGMGEAYAGNSRRSDLDADTPYNT